MSADRPFGSEVRQVLGDAMAQARAEHGISRERVAVRMSELTGSAVTVPMLNAFTAESHRQHRFPFEFAVAFEEATRSHELQRLLARKRGSLLLVGADAAEMRLHEVRERMRDLRREERALLHLCRVLP